MALFEVDLVLIADAPTAQQTHDTLQPFGRILCASRATSDASMAENMKRIGNVIEVVARPFQLVSPPQNKGSATDKTG